jgi:HD-like signal output (HDOD) protein
MNSTQLPRGIEAWVAALSGAEVPVLARTISEIGKLKRREDDVTAREISNAVLRDPLFTLRILRYIEAQRKLAQPAEITTIEHAIMMLGAAPFFRACTQLTSVEARLSGDAKGLAGYRQVLSRASHAATYARSWAAHRSDSESDEVIIATLLHDLAEMMLWCFYPQAALDIESIMSKQPGLRSADAQEQVLGINLHQLQLALCTAWKLPNLLRDLMDDTQAHVPRVKNVVLAVSLARHSAHGWEDAGLPDDYAATAAFLKLPQREVCERIVRLAISAAAADSWYEVAGTASLLPALLPFAEADAPRGVATGLKRAQEKLLAIVLELLPARQRAPDDANASLNAVRTLVSAAVHMLHTELGLPRTMFAAASPLPGGGTRLAAAASASADGAALKGFNLTSDEPNVLGRLLETGGSIWVSPDNREAMNALLTPALIEQIGDGEFVATAVKPGAGPVLGILYADRGWGSGGMDLTMATACNHLARFLGLCIGKLRESEARALGQRETATAI